MSLIFIDFLLTVKAATLIFISGRGSAISSSKEGKSGANFINKVCTMYLKLCVRCFLRSAYVSFIKSS